MKSQIKEQIIKYSKELRIPSFRKDCIQIAQQAAQDGKSHEDYLLDLMKAEYENRIENRKKQRIRSTNFPYRKYLESLQREELPKEALQKLEKVYGAEHTQVKKATLDYEFEFGEYSSES